MFSYLKRVFDIVNIHPFPSFCAPWILSKSGELAQISELHWDTNGNLKVPMNSKVSIISITECLIFMQMYFDYNVHQTL